MKEVVTRNFRNAFSDEYYCGYIMKESHFSLTLISIATGIRLDKLEEQFLADPALTVADFYFCNDFDPISFDIVNLGDALGRDDIEICIGKKVDKASANLFKPIFDKSTIVALESIKNILNSMGIHLVDETIYAGYTRDYEG